MTQEEIIQAISDDKWKEQEMNFGTSTKRR